MGQIKGVFSALGQLFSVKEAMSKSASRKFLLSFQVPVLLLLRWQVRRRLTRQTRKALSQLTVVAFPNALNGSSRHSHHGYAIEKIFHALAIVPRQFDPWMSVRNTLFINWQDMTRDRVDSAAYMHAAYSYTGQAEEFHLRRVINADARDISKKTVGKNFNLSFGYPLDVDPTTYSGSMVVKSDLNATHDGKVVEAPVAWEEDQENLVFNVHVDNGDGHGNVVDFRVPFIRRPLDFAYRKVRPVQSRFSNINSSVTLEKTADHFSQLEIDGISAFCQMMGLDYGELDCLRDAVSGKIFIVDVAKTPAGPPNGLSFRLKVEAIKRMSVAFAEEFIADSANSRSATNDGPEVVSAQ